MSWMLNAGDRVVVLGCGVSGVAGARLCHAQGAKVWVVDEAREEGRVAEVARGLREMGVEFGHVLPEGGFDLCVVSPGFGVAHAWVRACVARGVKVISELELGARYWRGKVLAITGSKGKSSLVKVCCDALNGGGMRAVPAGNYGTPLSAQVLDAGDAAWAVTEVSSFQLEFVEDFAPDVAVLLNMQVDHLDRHGDEATYRACKLRLFARMGKGSVALLPEGLAEFGEMRKGLEACGARCEDFGDRRAVWCYGDGVVARQGLCHAAVKGSWFDNPVLGLAAAAGVGALAACGLGRAEIEQGFRGYVALRHRMERVAEAEGVRWVDDSKATSFAAVAAALRMTEGAVRLIAGGRIKEREVGFVKELLTRRAKKVYLIGECAEFLAQSWGDGVACEMCGDMAAAVRRASDDASAGETVLLSPGCASFDQFASYHERGEVFARLAREAAARKGHKV